jgi:acyl-CoA synthetase (AMP-forming)/AMP-acid ligase II
MMRQGDLGRWNSTGHMEIMGRINSNQIKIRGQRLEVDEVEATIADVAGMKEVAVAYHRTNSQVDGRLIGYVVPPPESEHCKAQAHNETVLVEAWEQHYDTNYAQDDMSVFKVHAIGLRANLV